MTTLATEIACGFRFCKAKVQFAELLTGTLPKLKGTPLEQPETLVNVGAVTPEPIKMTDSELICRLALKLAVEVGVNETVMFKACVTLEFGGMVYGSNGDVKVNPAPLREDGDRDRRRGFDVFVDPELHVGRGIESDLAEVIRRADYRLGGTIHRMNYQLRLGGDGEQRADQ